MAEPPRHRKRPILLIADQAWDAPGGGAVILRSLLGNRIGSDMVWVTPSRTGSDPVLGHYGLAAGSVGTGRYSVLRDSLLNAGRLAAEVQDLAQRINAVGLWAVLHGSTVAIASHLARKCDLPMHATVHDDPVYATAIRSRRLAIFAPLIARQFRIALQAARSVDVVCDSMADRYRRKYGVSSIVLHRGLSDPVSPSPTYDLAREGLTVGILGNTYSFRQLPILGRMVELAAQRLNVRAKIVVCGESYGLRLKRLFEGRIEVEVTGHVEESKGIERLRRCAVLYLNYPFGWFSRVLRETSFPTKLSTYVYAARPLLIHAPPGTSLSGLSSAHSDYAIPWETMDPVDGASRLIAWLENSRFDDSRHIAADAMRLRYYNYDVHRATLDRFLDQLSDSRVSVPGEV
ncbi:MAG: hypothetical protein WCL32_00960 [Planctomycetota bacterium]